MLQITGITNNSKQKMTVRLSDGSSFVMFLEYKPMQLGWFITELTYKDFTAYNLRVVSSPNMLHKFRNLIPFGLGCFVNENQEPTTVQDFSSSRAILYVLTADEVTGFTEILSGQETA